MRENHVNRPHLYVVVLQPGIPYSAGVALPILFEYSIGKREEWEKWDGKSFDDFARGKAALSWRMNLSSQGVILTKLQLIRPGDCLLWGSSIVGGVITGVSSVQPFFDEIFATMTSAAIVGETSYYADQMAQNLDAPDFFPLS
ncbi:hypothetical protein COU17_02855 [Candidatus Kaiserbacteria bacterium CG10_big_fil_rev_8_21_14_0_10_49_17]|uniref:Uncharacterized protein n=1 Tax=Candidatus Kaiserbacteria bacterium CG10_big_fil_rev_8_21_14_0_10_49_17 TaxID=1974609 RepID=A0A2M6WDY8_9BACT|nr:MAG: hypothetical protein COU17_02855 [Candidatus Kaiserbacteria bacterium CG10_big_fil_rev_8_21_14_0_10_49_17]